MKTYVLMISRVFPAYHPRAGQETYFMSKILLNYDQVLVEDEGNQHASNRSYSAKYAAAIVKEMGFEPKLHTIRGSYDLWKKRVDKINRGEAILSLRQWTGSPYNFKRDGSKQVEILQLTKVGIQSLIFDPFLGMFIDGVDSDIQIDTLAKNDGLTLQDFKAWFKNKLEYNKPMAVIQFTDFKYINENTSRIKIINDDN